MAFIRGLAKCKWSKRRLGGGRACRGERRAASMRRRSNPTSCRSVGGLYRGGVGRRRLFTRATRWPERRQRKVKWLSANEAAAAVRDPRLGTIIRRLAR
jgi:hypothetical protein